MFINPVHDIAYVFILVVTITLIFFFMSYFPIKKISNFFEKNFRNVSGILFIFLICYSFFSVLQTYFNENIPSEAEAKYITSCKMVEENIYHGVFSSNTNKLDCNGVIKNISVSDYQLAVEVMSKKIKGN